MFRATCRPSSGAQNCTSSLWFCIRERLLDVVVAGQCPATTTSLYKHGIINFGTLLHPVGYSVWIILWCTDPRTSSVQTHILLLNEFYIVLNLSECVWCWSQFSDGRCYSVYANIRGMVEWRLIQKSEGKIRVGDGRAGKIMWTGL
jgi:hypothetical protein